MKAKAERTRDLHDRLFWMPKETEIKDATTTDVYFQYAVDALKFARINPRVTMEVYTRKLPFIDTKWAIVTGIYEVAKLLEGIDVEVDAMDEGEVFISDNSSAIYEPVLQITGRYQDFAKYENPILGFLCQSSGVSTKAARISVAAAGKAVISFGTRRAHPSLSAMIERSSFIGGLDSVSNILGARLLEKSPSGTMPHSFIICVGDEVEAWRIFDQALPKEIPRITLIDTFSDEKFAAIRALNTLGSRLYGVRLDTPSTRRGDLRKIVQEVRWELSVRGGKDVKIFVSGGLDESDLHELRQLVDGFGVGTSISAATVIDFGGKIVEIENPEGESNLLSKRGDISGKKHVYRDEKTFRDIVTLDSKKPGTSYRNLLTPLLREGKIVRDFEPVDLIRKRVERSVKRVSKSNPSISSQ